MLHKGTFYALLWCKDTLFSAMCVTEVRKVITLRHEKRIFLSLLLPTTWEMS